MTIRKSALFLSCFVTAIAAPALAQPPAAGPVTNIVTVADYDKSLGGPTLVTLVADGKPLAEVLADLSKQAGIKIIADKDLEGIKVSAKFAQPTSFWLVLRSLLNDNKLNFNKTTGLITVVRPGGNDWWRPRTYGTTKQVGPFLLSVSMVSRTRQRATAMNAPADANTTSAAVEMQFFEDPKVNLINRGVQNKVDSSVDDTGVMFENPNNQGPAAGFNGNGGGAANQSFGISQVGAESHALKSMKGAFLAPVWTKAETWTIDNPLKTENLVRQQGHWSMTFGNAKANGDRFDVSVSIKLEGMENDFKEYVSNDRTLMNALSQTLGDAILADADGKPLRRDDMRVDTVRDPNDRGTIRAMNVKLMFSSKAPAVTVPGGGPPPTPGPDIAGAPVKFSWVLPQEITNVLVPFEFNDLPLP